MAEESTYTQKSVVLSPQQLALYAELDPALPYLITQSKIEFERREFWFAQTQGFYGFALSVLVISGAIYLAMHGHDAVAGVLLGAGAVSIITGFQVSRLYGTKPATPLQAAKDLIHKREKKETEPTS